MPLSLLTPTGGRPEAFALLERWISQQTYKGEIDWVVVDDVNPRTVATMGQNVCRPATLWTHTSRPTLVQNLMLGLAACKFDKILFVEDDECYLPEYLSAMSAALDRSCIAGQMPARYFNVFHRAYRVIPNAMHASLCQTGIRRSLIPVLTSIVAKNGPSNPFVDIPLWQAGRLQADYQAGLEPRMDVLSIKGMPGRAGIGAGHRSPSGHWILDPDLDWLGSQIGQERAMLYRIFGGTTQNGKGGPLT